MAFTADVVYIALETFTIAVAGKPAVVHEGDRIVGATLMTISAPEGSFVVDGSAPWTVQAAKDALRAARGA